MLVTKFISILKIFRLSTCQNIFNCLTFTILLATHQSYGFSLNIFASKSPISFSFNRNALLIRTYTAFFNCTYDISDPLGPLTIYFPYSFGSVLTINSTIFPRKTMWGILSYGRDALINAPGMSTMVTSLPSASLIAILSITNYRSTAGANASIG